MLSCFRASRRSENKQLVGGKIKDRQGRLLRWEWFPRYVKPSRSLSEDEARFHWKSCGPGVTYAVVRPRRWKEKKKRRYQLKPSRLNRAFSARGQSERRPRHHLGHRYARLHLVISARSSGSWSTIHDRDLTIELRDSIGTDYEFTYFVLWVGHYSNKISFV